MSKVKAFPRQAYVPDDPENRLEPRERIEFSHEGQEGMDLRDYFAAKAMQGLLVSWTENYPDAKARKILTEKCYQIADAMLEAREK